MKEFDVLEMYGDVVILRNMSTNVYRDTTPPPNITKITIKPGEDAVALKKLLDGETEVFHVQPDAGYRYYASLTASKSCLRCHWHKRLTEGKEVSEGDLIGTVKITINGAATAKTLPTKQPIRAVGAKLAVADAAKAREALERANESANRVQELQAEVDRLNRELRKAKDATKPRLQPLKNR